jgi:CrcB protein
MDSFFREENCMWSLVALGGALGALARWQTGIWITKRVRWGWPVGTFFVNASGSFLLGAVFHFHSASEWWLLLGTGFLGAFTTFSTFGYETVQMLLSGQWRRGIAYALASVFVCVPACLIGSWILD